MKFADLLIDLGVSTSDSIQLYRKGTRDRSDIDVYKCNRSGTIFLESDEHLTPQYYEQMQDFSYWGTDKRAEATRKTIKDDTRRANLIRSAAQNKRWLDIGTGAGGILDLVAPVCAEAVAVEPQAAARRTLQDSGYSVLADIQAAPEGQFDLITLFHVYEHVTNPVEFLANVRRRLAPRGRICIEVPHAGDALISLYNCQAFIDFTLWSEHLILHSHRSLGSCIAAGGFSTCEIFGIQRYPAANHLYWLANQKPGGQDVWPNLSNQSLDAAYEATLAKSEMTDTLMAWAVA